MAMSSAAVQLRITDEIATHTLDRGVFQSAVLAEGLTFMQRGHWESDARSPSLPDISVRFRTSTPGMEAVVGDLCGALVWMKIEDGHLDAWIAAPDPRTIQEVDRFLRERFPVPPLSVEQRLPIMLWVLTPGGPRRIRRKIDVPTWEEIRENYSAGVAQQMTALLEGRPQAGRIILWHGHPGTGKTWALRALAWEWRSWLDVHYVVDPEVMFSKQPAYLLQTILDEDEGDAPVGGKTEPRWRLLVLEDTGEMLAPDAKEHVGQGLSRLLNVTDGLIGQGLRILILVTTNEEVGRLHPAIARPGRCAARIRFTDLDAVEAQAWMAARDGGRQIVKAASIAELFGILNGYAEPQEAVMGFTG